MTPESRKVQEYRRTIPGLVTMIYANQKMTSKKMGRSAPTYSKQQLLDWLQSDPCFQRLFANWEAAGHPKDLSPSVDRIDNSQGYSLTNIQIVTWRQNLLNQKAHNISGRYLHTGSKAVLQLALDGTLVAVHGSIANAMRALTGKRGSVSNISNVANGKWPTAYGYKWAWA